MKDNEIVTIDTRFSSLLGPLCKCAEVVAGQINDGNKVRLLVSSAKGFNAQISGKSFTWDPKSHPESYFSELLQSTFGKNLEVVYTAPLSPIWKFINIGKGIIKKNYIIHYDYAWGLLDNGTFQHFLSKIPQELAKNRSNPFDFIGTCTYWLYVTLKPWLRKNLKGDGFQYKLSSAKVREFENNYINEFKQKFKLRVLITPTWDDSNVFEPMPDRVRGVDYDDIEFNQMINFVKGLKRKFGHDVGFVLASKKAVDWQSIVPKNQMLDIRNFEEHRLSLGESIFLASIAANISVSWPSTYCIWITSQKDLQHFVWGGSRDAALGNAQNIYLSPTIDQAIKKIEQRFC